MVTGAARGGWRRQKDTSDAGPGTEAAGGGAGLGGAAGPLPAAPPHAQAGRPTAPPLHHQPLRPQGKSLPGYRPPPPPLPHTAPHIPLCWLIVPKTPTNPSMSFKVWLLVLSLDHFYFLSRIGLCWRSRNDESVGYSFPMKLIPFTNRVVLAFTK